LYKTYYEITYQCITSTYISSNYFVFNKFYVPIYVICIMYTMIRWYMVYFTCLRYALGSIPPFYVLNVCTYVYNIRWSNLFEKYIRYTLACYAKACFDCFEFIYLFVLYCCSSHQNLYNIVIIAIWLLYRVFNLS